MILNIVHIDIFWINYGAQVRAVGWDMSYEASQNLDVSGLVGPFDADDTIRANVSARFLEMGHTLTPGMTWSIEQ